METSQVNFNNLCAQFSFLNSLNYSEGLRKDYPSVFEQMYGETQEMRKGRLPPNWKAEKEEEEASSEETPQLDELLDKLPKAASPRKVIASLPAN